RGKSVSAKGQRPCLSAQISARAGGAVACNQQSGVASEASESPGECGNGWFVMEPLNILLSICSNESLASARADVLSRNGYSVITMQTVDDAASFCAMLDVQAVIIDQTLCPGTNSLTLARFAGIPVLQLRHLIH